MKLVIMIAEEKLNISDSYLDYLFGVNPDLSSVVLVDVASWSDDEIISGATEYMKDNDNARIIIVVPVGSVRTIRLISRIYANPIQGMAVVAWENGMLPLAGDKKLVKKTA